MVVIDEPSAWTASIAHDFTARPSTMHGARAALAGVAADVGAGEAEVLAQQLDQQAAWLHLRRSWVRH